ncbi:AsmA family protein [Stakelama saccharophila]|uniref:AsmA family protein n=1 Tax=Stakelama saccharophila TaxID=3075605 RepID=A0ABZ0BAG9_9SPHN|nr:AsmA family protein [Stakelama sp. W311]WNO54410.1 AsmA family protein [Stakelama sp. W311]
MADRDTPIAAVDTAQADEPPVLPDTGSRADDRTPHNWPRWAKIALRTVIGIVAVLFLAWLTLYITKGRFLKHSFERIASAQTGRTVRVAGDFQFYFNPVNIKFYAEGLSVSNPAWAGEGNFFDAGRIDTDIATLTFLFGDRRVNWLDLVDGEVNLKWDADRRRNTWTFGDPNRKGEPLDLPTIRRASFAGTTIHYDDPKMRLTADVDVRTVKTSGTRFRDAIRFDGKGTARGNAFTMTGALLSPNSTVEGGQNQLALHLRGARTDADITGTLPGPTELEGAKLHMDVRGSNIADIFAVAGIAVPDTRTYHLTSAATKQGEEWRFAGLKGTFGDSDLAGRLTVRTGEPRLKLIADLTTDTLDIVDIGPFIGYDPDRLEAQGGKGAIRTVGGHPRLLPDAELRVEALRNFDADLDYRVRRVRAKNLPVSNVDLALTLDDRLLTLSPLTFDMARGHVSSDIKINARKSPVFTEYDIRLSPTPMGVLLAGWGVEQSGTTGTLKARVKMTGSGDTVHQSLSHANGRIAIIMPKGSFWTRNVQLSELDVGTFVQKMFEKKLKEPVQINCGLIGFTVRDGIAAADPILIDTDKNVMLGHGGFSFRNEALDLAFRADSKKFSLFSGQSPVGIGGYFAAPEIDVVSPELLGRAGSAIGLAVVATPLASVLSFVDIGDAKAAACGPVLRGARAAAQRTSKGERRDDVGAGTTAKSENGKQSGDETKQQRKKFLGIF